MTQREWVPGKCRGRRPPAAEVSFPGMHSIPYLAVESVLVFAIGLLRRPLPPVVRFADAGGFGIRRVEIAASPVGSSQ